MTELKNNLKTNVANTVSTTKRVIGNAEEFVLASSLVIVSIYNAYDLAIRLVDDIEFYVRAFASVVIGIKGAWAVIQFFNKKK